MAGDIDRLSLTNSNDLWNNEFACTTGKLCVSLTTVYYNSTFPEGTVESCPNAYARISLDIADEYSRAWKDIKAKVFGTASAVAETDIPVYLGEVTPFLMSVSLTGENLVRQAITIQSLNQVSAEFATAIAYQEAYLNALARLNMLDFGRGGTLNTMKGVIGTILVGLTPAFAILFLTPIGGRIFSGWVTAFIWLILWSVAEVITVSFLYLSVGDNQKFDLTLSQIDRINLAFNKAAQISSLMSDYIPLLTLFLATGSLYAMTHFAKGMSRELRDEHGTKVMASGNFDVGNVRSRGYSDLTTAIANSSIGDYRFSTAQVGVYMGDRVDYGNVSTSQINTFDPSLGAHISGIKTGPDSYLGSVNTGTYKGHGSWKVNGNRLMLVNGRGEATTSNALYQMTGGQISGLRNAEVQMASGQLVYAKGIDEQTGAEVTYRKSSDGIETMTYSYGSWSAQLIKDKDGNWKVVGGKGPVDINFAEKYAQNLENSKAQMERVASAFRKTEGISNMDSQTFNAGYRLAYDIASGRGGASEYERGFATDLIRATEESALTKLGNEGRLSVEGKEIDEMEARKRMQGGIELNSKLLEKVLPKNIRNKIGFGVQKAISTKDGYVVQDSKGRYWFFGKNETINEALRDAWKINMSGENKDFFNYRENTTGSDYTSEDLKKDISVFRSRMGEYASSKAEELGRKLSYVQQNARDINAKATQLLIGEYISQANGENIQERTGKALFELNNLVSSPDGIQSLMERADRIADKLIEDRELQKPEINEADLQKATKEAEDAGKSAKGVSVTGLSKNPEEEYRNRKEKIQQKGRELKEDYNLSRKSVDLQRDVYRDTMQSPLEDLPKLEQFNQVRNELQGLLKQKYDLMSRVENERKDLNRDIGIVLASTSGGYLNRDKLMEIISNPEKLREYRESGPPDRIDPNILEGLSRRYASLQEMEGRLSEVQKQLDEMVREYEELYPYAVAKDLQEGNFETKYRNDKGPGKHPQIETVTEDSTGKLDNKVEQYKQERHEEELKKDPQKWREHIRKELRESIEKDKKAIEDLFG